jgi:VCBS repeat-containing protein
VNLPTSEDVTASGQFAGADPDGDSLTYSIISNGSKGVATITSAATGAFSYAPAKNENGQDTLTYRVSDGKLTTDAKVIVTIAAVNDAPLAANATLSTPEDTLVSGQLLGSDPDGDRLSYSIVTNGSKGTASIVDSTIGLFTYTPSANQEGQDSFVYRASDGFLTTDATVTVTIVPINHAPNAVPMTLWATEDVKASGQLPGSDADGDRLTYSIVTNGNKGKVAITNTATGTFTYTPVLNANGQDTFVYRVSDGTLSTDATVTVIINPVNDAPKALADLAKVSRGKSFSIPVLANDTDVDGDSLTVASVTVPTYGKAAIVNGAVVYTANATFIGNITFSYSVADGKGGKATGAVTVTVAK